MVRRIFIAINLPEEIQEELYSLEEQYSAIPAKWTPQENLHITLVFLGNTSDTELMDLISLCKEVSRRHEKFPLELSAMLYGPSKDNPRMIWASFAESAPLVALQKDLAKTLSYSEKLSFVKEKRPFSAHLTLARLNQLEFRQIEPEERPVFDTDLSLQFSAKSIEVMESELKRDGARYTVLQSISL